MIKIINVDCMDFMSNCEDNQFDLAITDPPYFEGPNKLGYFGSSKSSSGIIRKGYAKTNNWEVPSDHYFKELKRVSCEQIVFGINYFDIYLGPGRIIWDKVNGESSFSDCEIAYTSCHDSVRMISYMWNGMLQGKSISEGRTQLGNKKKNEKRIHPTQKPVKLYEWLIQKYAVSGMHILDTHLGSGSICIAAHSLGVNLTGCEINSKYAKMAQKRYDIFSKQLSF